MAKELPYFRFTAQEWQNGDISLERLELKGLFIDVCSYYWVKNCSLELTTLKKKFQSSSDLIDELVDLNIIKSKKERISIPFLDLQMSELLDISSKRKSAGAKGGKSYSRWGEAERKKGSQLYLILLSNENEIFLKVGSTTTSISDRYSNTKDYEITTIFQIFSPRVVELESKIHNELAGYNYTPSIKFGGHTECYNINCTKVVSQLFENHNPLVVNELDSSISKVQAKKKQSTSYKDKDKDKDNNKDNNKDNDNSGAPSLFEFLEYCKTITEFNFVEYEYSLKSKYQQWVDNDWRDGHDKKIKNWKTKIQNTYPFLTKTQPQKQASKYIPTERDKW